MNSAKKNSSTFQLFNFSTLLVALLAAHPASAMETATITSGNDTKQLLGGTIYTVSGDVSVTRTDATARARAYCCRAT